MSWSKGFTKLNHQSLRQTSDTMRARKLDNFKVWRDRMKAEGKIKSSYPPYKRDGDLAELIGVILGDGYLGKMARVEELTIACNSNAHQMIARYAKLVHKVFGKKPYLQKSRVADCTKIRIYEKNIARRLGLPIGAKKDKVFEIPSWVMRNKEYKLRLLRGLYEAEGSFSVHLPTSTYKLQFCNRNKSLLQIVLHLMEGLGFKVNLSGYKVQISRRAEVYRAKDLIHFEIMPRLANHCGII